MTLAPCNSMKSTLPEVPKPDMGYREQQKSDSFDVFKTNREREAYRDFGRKPRAYAKMVLEAG